MLRFRPSKFHDKDVMVLFLAVVAGDNTVAEDVSIGNDAGDIDDKLGFTDDNDAPTELVGLSELLSLTDL